MPNNGRNVHSILHVHVALLVRHACATGLLNGLLYEVVPVLGVLASVCFVPKIAFVDSRVVPENEGEDEERRRRGESERKGTEWEPLASSTVPMISSPQGVFHRMAHKKGRGSIPHLPWVIVLKNRRVVSSGLKHHKAVCRRTDPMIEPSRVVGCVPERDRLRHGGCIFHNVPQPEQPRKAPESNLFFFEIGFVNTDAFRGQAGEGARKAGVADGCVRVRRVVEVVHGDQLELVDSSVGIPVEVAAGEDAGVTCARAPNPEHGAVAKQRAALQPGARWSEQQRQKLARGVKLEKGCWALVPFIFQYIPVRREEGGRDRGALVYMRRPVPEDGPARTANQRPQ